MTKKISGIWAQDQEGLIGKNQALPWHLPADLQQFKERTSGHALVMGRVTFDGMGRRVLPNRQSIILTRDETYQVDHSDVLVLTSVEEVLSWYAQQDKQLFVIGGGQIFSAFEPYLEQVIRTVIEGEFEGDTYFPKDFDWSVYEQKEKTLYSKDAGNPHAFCVEVWERKENN